MKSFRELVKSVVSRSLRKDTDTTQIVKASVPSDLSKARLNTNKVSTSISKSTIPIQSLSRLRQSSVEKYKEKNTHKIENRGIKVSVSTRAIQKSISKVIEEKRKVLDKVTSEIELVKDETKEIAEVIMSKARLEAQSITESVKKMYEQASIELERAKGIQKSTEESALGLKMAQKQMETEKIGIESAKESLKSEQYAIDLIKQDTTQRIDELKDVLDSLSVLTLLVVKNVQPIINKLEQEGIVIEKSLTKLKESSDMIEIERIKLQAQKDFQESIGIQQNTEWVIIKDRREQLDRVATELSNKKHG